MGEDSDDERAPERVPRVLIFCCKGVFNPDDETELYDRLGVARTASDAEIRRAFRRLSLSLHPDKLRQRGVVPTPEANARFARAREAYEALSTPTRRAVYALSRANASLGDDLGDEKLRGRRPPPAPLPPSPVHPQRYDGLGRDGARWYADPSTIDARALGRKFLRAPNAARCRALAVVGGALA